jgi:hypothetical protein
MSITFANILASVVVPLAFFYVIQLTRLLTFRQIVQANYRKEKWGFFIDKGRNKKEPAPYLNPFTNIGWDHTITCGMLVLTTTSVAIESGANMLQDTMWSYYGTLIVFLIGLFVEIAINAWKPFPLRIVATMSTAYLSFLCYSALYTLEIRGWHVFALCTLWAVTPCFVWIIWKKRTWWQ